MGRKQDNSFKASGDMRRLVSLGGGTHAYLMHPITGKTLHLRRGSEQWNTEITALLENDEFGARIQNELERLGWN